MEMLSYHFVVFILLAYTAILAKAKDFDDDDHFGPSGICNQAYPTFDLSGVNQPLEELKSILPDDDGVTRVQLSLNLAHYKGPSYTTIMRTWNRQTPGPAIHVKPGSTMELELINCLHPPVGNQERNVFSSPNTTNIHTHGPHISGELPGDDIFAKVEPSSSMKFKYVFPTNHMVSNTDKDMVYVKFDYVPCLCSHAHLLFKYLAWNTLDTSTFPWLYSVASWPRCCWDVDCRRERGL